MPVVLNVIDTVLQFSGNVDGTITDRDVESSKSSDEEEYRGGELDINGSDLDDLVELGSNNDIDVEQLCHLASSTSGRSVIFAAFPYFYRSYGHVYTRC